MSKTKREKLFDQLVAKFQKKFKKVNARFVKRLSAISNKKSPKDWYIAKNALDVWYNSEVGKIVQQYVDEYRQFVRKQKQAK